MLYTDAIINAVVSVARDQLPDRIMTHKACEGWSCFYYKHGSITFLNYAYVYNGNFKTQIGSPI
jgi:hypothetical protein